MKYQYFLFAALAATLMSACNDMPHADSNWPVEDRTANQSGLGIVSYPDWIMAKPEHYEFSTLKSNHDPQNDHPAQWDGQDWDTSMWNKDWTPELTIKRFYAVRILNDQYGEKGEPVLERVFVRPIEPNADYTRT